MSAVDHAPIEGSQRDVWPGCSNDGPPPTEGDITLTAWFAGAVPDSLAPLAAFRLAELTPAKRAYADRKSIARSSDADPADRARFTAYCAERGVEVVETHWRSAVVSGPLPALVEAFGANVISSRDGNGHRFRQRSGALYAPPELAPKLRGVFGFQQKPRSSRLGALSRHATPLAARDVAERYGFPDATGDGQTIAIVQFRGEFRGDDFELCMNAHGVTAAKPSIKRVDDASLAHEHATSKDLESALDAQLVSALAPGARVVIYEAPDDERGFLDAVRSAIFDEESRPSILSISYGWPEFLWTPAALTILNDLFCAAALLGISVFCSSGDNGDESDYDGLPHVLAPAASPLVHACGATCIVGDAASSEIPWEKAGGGLSSAFPAPPWQGAATRAVPDVAAQQQPGYLVYLEGTELAVGGTSAVAPLWAALAARLNQRLGVAAGLFTPALYRAKASVFANADWNPRSGLGAPNGAALETLLRSE